MPSIAPSNSLAAASADAAAPAYESEQSGSRLAARQQLGTGHGQRRWDSASTTRFDRDSARPRQVVSLRYDSTEALAARGILPRQWPQPYGTPEAFPIGFAPDPY